MTGSRSNSGAAKGSGLRSRWAPLLPWAVLPLALAIITAVDWLWRARRPTPRKEAP